MPYQNHLSNSAALVTTKEAKRAGFVSAVLEKSRIADAFITDARTLKVKAEMAKSPEELLNIIDIQADLLTAAGVSDKATAYLDETDRQEILQKYIERVLKPAGTKFVEELVYRFLLTRGDTLGGKIRNLVGVWAQRKFSEFVVSNLQLAGTDFEWFHREELKWKSPDILSDFDQIKALSWKESGYLPSRVLAYNMLVPFIKTDEEADVGDSEATKRGKNVDICLLSCTPEEYRSKAKRPKIVRDLQQYIALGELKGGIDPSGADEHWKTASAHLSRIRRSFAGLQSSPHLFFVGNAIESNMAGEIWSQLTSGLLANAANLTDDRQAVSLTTWLCNL